jgi:hypothetical protein
VTAAAFFPLVAVIIGGFLGRRPPTSPANWVAIAQPTFLAPVMYHSFFILFFCLLQDVNAAFTTAKAGLNLWAPL